MNMQFVNMYKPGKVMKSLGASNMHMCTHVHTYNASGTIVPSSYWDVQSSCFYKYYYTLVQYSH